MERNRATFLVRVWLPDRPGALGAVASRVGAVGGDIVAVDVVDRGGGQAVDDLVVELPSDHLDLMVREVRAVDGVEVEEVHAIGEAPPDLGLGVLQAATDLVRAIDRQELAACLARHACRVVRLEWAAVCDTATGAIHGAVGPSPDAAWLGAYAMGVTPPDSGLGDALPVAARDPQIATTSLPDLEVVLIGGRDRLSIRPRERALFEALAAVAGERWDDVVGSPRR
jgi:hypothetical protein